MIFRRQDLETFRRSVLDERVLISTHVHPDPDAIGSTLAMREMLLQIGSRPDIILADLFAPRIRWLPGGEAIQTLPLAGTQVHYDVAVILDAANRSRIGDVEHLLNAPAVVYNFDHHISNDSFGTHNFVDVACCATGELLFQLCRGLELEITAELATNLYAGLLTDTGRFRYSNTNPQVFKVAAELVEAGANPTEITNRLYFDLPPDDLRSMSAIYATLTMFGDSRISTLMVRREHLVEDPDSVIDLALSIRGVEIAAMLSEAPQGKIRVSLRSKNYVNVSEIAQHFGGGGHEKAAGFRMSGTLESVRDRMLPALLEALNVGLQKPTTVEI
jgi:phosphoesterase RecJ-like protein